MISFITIILFLVYLLGLGFTVTYSLRKPEHRGERLLLYLAMGLGILPILAILINFLHLPLDWKLFLVLSLLFPTYILGRKIQKKELKLNELKLLSFASKLTSFKLTSFKLTKSSLYLTVVLLIFALTLFMYTKGAFAYPYLEDEDPWGHAVGVKYVALEKTAYDPQFQKDRGIDPVLAYIDPVPPAYDILLGILHQTSPDLTWTLKFFNTLIISLGVLFFYLFAQAFLGSREKALLATLVLAAVPAYLSHFIWSHGLAVTLFFPTMYAFLQLQQNNNNNNNKENNNNSNGNSDGRNDNNSRRWFYLSSLLVASIWVVQSFEEPIKLTVLLLLYLIITSVTSRHWSVRPFLSIVTGLALSLFWWGVMMQKYTLRGFVRYFTGERIFPGVVNPADITSLAASSSTAGSSVVNSFSLFHKLSEMWHSLTSPGGSGSRAYSASDFLFARGENMINNPIGIGLVVSLLVLLGVIYALWHYRRRLVEPSQTWLAVTLIWLIYTFWAVNGQTFPFSIARGPFRTWLLLAIPVALLAAEGARIILSFFRPWKLVRILVLVLLLLGVVLTSGYPKYQVNTSIWPTSGTFNQPGEVFEYAVWFKTLPPDTTVFLYSPRDKIVIGLGKYSCLWCEEVLDFRNQIIYQDADALHTFLKSQGYEYLVLNGRMDSRYFGKTFGENATTTLLPQRYNEILNSRKFVPVYQKENLFLALRVV